MHTENPLLQKNHDVVDKGSAHLAAEPSANPSSPIPGHYQAYRRTSFSGIKTDNLFHQPLQVPPQILSQQQTMNPAPVAAQVAPVPPANPYQKYKEQSLATLTPGELLVKLYEELGKQMKLAEISIEKKRYDTANNALTKCQTILNTLESSLDMQYDLSNNLRDLYIFIAKQMLEANIKKNVKPIQDCLPLVHDLHDAFEQAEKDSRKSQHVAVGSNAL